MNILSHGMPFFRHPSLLNLYHGRHSIRSIGAQDGCDYRYDPARNTLAEILAQIGRDWRPDLLLFWFPENDPPPLGVEDSPIPTVAMAGDWNLFYPYLRVNLARYDHVLCDKGAVNVLASPLVEPFHLFPLYAHNSVLHRHCQVEKDIDILFAGSMEFARYRERGRWLERLARLGNRYRVALVDNAYGESYNLLLNRARIVFNHSVRGELNLRTFETLSTGSLAFVETDNLEVRDFFRDGVDVVLYSDENLDERLAYFLEHRNEAEAIAARGHARAPEFAIENRLDDLIDWIAGRPAGARRFRDLPQAERELQTFLMYSGTLTPEYAAIEQRQMSVATNSAPYDPRVWAAAGKCLLTPRDGVMMKHRAGLAIKILERAAALAPNSVPCAFNVVTAFMQLGRESETEPFLRKVLDCQGEDLGEFLIGWIHTPRPWRPHCRMWNRCLVAQARKQPFLPILHAEAHVRLARFHVTGRAYGKAEERLEQARILDPENLSRVTLLADILWQTGRREEAVEVLWNERDSFHIDVPFREDLLAKLESIGDTRRNSDYREETSAVLNTVVFSLTVSPPTPDP